MLRYPVKLSRDTNGTILVEAPDIPEAHTFGEDQAEALLRSRDAIETALSMYIDDRRPIPRPSPAKRGSKLVTLPALTEAKIALYSAMRQQGVGKGELARRLSCHLTQIDRMLDLFHRSHMDQLEAAFRALGREISITVSRAA
ncbi:MAG: type II toxin-antitoxin system HicB family antitoxin [Acidobacteriia bacterium]|nr:type II toxin-antitoxin system HicB family antitoxin [Terriglobia bacterium]